MMRHDERDRRPSLSLLPQPIAGRSSPRRVWAPSWRAPAAGRWSSRRSLALPRSCTLLESARYCWVSPPTTSSPHKNCCSSPSIPVSKYPSVCVASLNNVQLPACLLPVDSPPHYCVPPSLVCEAQRDSAIGFQNGSKPWENFPFT